MSLDQLVDPNMKILIADDMRTARLALRKHLAELGFTNVVEAADGLEALGMLQRDPDVELIICDWQMPNMEGVELASRLQDDPRFSHIPFIMATSKNEWQDLARATVAGVFGYVTKPFTAESLSQELEGVFAELSDEPGE